MIYSHEVEMMCPVAQGANHGPAPIPEDGCKIPKICYNNIRGRKDGVLCWNSSVGSALHS